MKLGRLRQRLAYYLSPIYLPDPSSISIFLTPYCNLKCSMCWQYGDQGIFKSANEAYTPLSLSEFSSVIDDVAGFRPRIMLWGGEPLLYPDFIPLVRHIKEKNLRLQIITNGALVLDNAEAIVSMGVDKMVFSFDGPENLHNSIRGVSNAFSRSKEGILELERLKKQFKTKKPAIIINFTISPLNYARIVETVSVLEDLPIKSLLISHLWFTTMDLGKKHESLLMESLQSEAPSWRGFIRDLSGINIDVLHNQLQTVAHRKSPFEVNFVPPLTKKEVFSYYNNPSDTLNYHRCLIPWRTVSILPNGDITPCSDRPDYIVGNVKEKSINELWRGNKYQAFRKVLKRNGLLPLCYRCCELFLG